MRLSVSVGIIERQAGDYDSARVFPPPPPWLSMVVLCRARAVQNATTMTSHGPSTSD